MARENSVLLAFNRGLVSALAIARLDIKRIVMSASTMANWMPRLLGSMMLRPGLGYIVTRTGASSRTIPFIFSADDTAIIEITPDAPPANPCNINIIVDDAFIERVSVSAAVTNGTFTTDLTGWADADEGSAVSVWATGGYLSLTGNSNSYAARTQTVSLVGGDSGKEHAFSIVIERGPATLRVGSTSGDDNLINETELDTGRHSLACTPTTDMYVQLKANKDWTVLVDSIAVEAAGKLNIRGPWGSGISILDYHQSGDIVYVAGGVDSYPPYRIERRATRSWSIVKHEPVNGPFRKININPSLTITPSALTGNVTLTASRAFFKSTHADALIRHLSHGQIVTATLGALNDVTNEIKVDGTGARRHIHCKSSGTWVGTVIAQRKFTEDGTWEDMPANSFRFLANSASGANTWDATESSNFDRNFTDLNEGRTTWYRLKMSAYTSGSASVEITCRLNGIEGIARISSVTSSTTALAVVLKDFGGTTASENWWEGEWSIYRGYPTAVTLTEGRLWWAGKDKILGSASDDYESHDDTIIGDSAPISRTIGTGPVDRIRWLLALQRLLIGGDTNEYVAQSSALDEPLTAAQFSIKTIGSQGAHTVKALRIDTEGVYVQRGGVKLMELSYDAKSGQYSPVDLTTIIPDIGSPGFVRIAVQRQPDTRVHCVRSDGTVAVLLYERTENVVCWVNVETDGLVTDVVVLPGDTGDGEDKVYYSVTRTINSSTVYYLEKWALETECIGATTSKCADSFIVITQASSTTITGLGHLEGEEVIVWANGKDLGTYTVSSGSITVSEAVTSATVGLTYTAQFRSSKLGKMLNVTGRINNLGVILNNTHYQGLKYGYDFTNMDELPLVSEGAVIAADTVHEVYDEAPFEFPGEWGTDNRLCLQAQAPRPCTILAATMVMEGQR